MMLNMIIQSMIADLSFCKYNDTNLEMQQRS